MVWREVAGAVEVALVHRPRYDDWSLPKGKVDPGESVRAAAWREVHEETGARVALGRALVRTRYRVGADQKVVDYFAARYGSGSFGPSDEVDEVDEVRWLPVPSASELVSYDHDRTVLDAFTELPPTGTTLLLVRHAKAGSRAEWTDVDELRPLSHNGRKQLEGIREFGKVYGADRVFSAPLVRCVQTVQPVADDLGVRVVAEELLAEKTYTAMAAAAERRISGILADGGVPVLCTQGGVIPDLVSRLAEASGLPMARPQSRKGSVWALFFDGPRMVAAEYTRTP